MSKRTEILQYIHEYKTNPDTAKASIHQLWAALKIAGITTPRGREFSVSNIQAYIFRWYQSYLMEKEKETINEAQ